jgi:hypothetical protein
MYQETPIETIPIREKTSFILKAIEDGWSVRKKNNNSYEFTYDNDKNYIEKKSNRSISLPITKYDFIKNIFVVD